MHRKVNRFTVAEKTRTCPESVVYDSRSYFTWTHQQHFIKEGKELTKTGPSLVWQEYFARLDGDRSHGGDRMRGSKCLLPPACPASLCRVLTCLQLVKPPLLVVPTGTRPLWTKHLRRCQNPKIPISLFEYLLVTPSVLCVVLLLLFACRLLTNHCTRQFFLKMSITLKLSSVCLKIKFFLWKHV